MEILTINKLHYSHGSESGVLFHLIGALSEFGKVGMTAIANSREEVDELYAEWKAAQAKIVSEPEDKPWKLREFLAADLDGNLIRVFYDFRRDV